MEQTPESATNTNLNLNKAVKSLSSEVVKKVTDEWSGVKPTDKDMGVVQLTLDKGVKTTVIGTIYGLDFEIEEDDYKVNVFFDYYNRRLKVIDYSCKHYSNMLRRLAWLAETNEFDKVFVKAKQEDFQKFLSRGYIMEGILRYYFNGEDAYVLSRFSSATRAESPDLVAESQLIEKIIYESKPKIERKLPENIRLIKADKTHIAQLIYIYRQVFETYPSPLTNPDYIQSVMGRNVHFVLAMQGDEPVAAASAEINLKYSNAELTDCASIPSIQGKGIMQFIMKKLENILKEEKVLTSYSLARAKSIGMNKSFFRLDYEYSGRLIKNCDIFGEFEDLNIWVKRI
ncbi:MAG: putative beta-lysine N-acetyltransferase [Bdellovibrionales bacterium]|nr:putative beta-lysine N-acetyltransferase [Bdellovibrionales bacterium]MBT3524961.1 putative beta-lysine N-acetyltransferase [Bdellovibrionales bacterium]MBT7670345.1 putative beta-lysine N-acetyltransferase [Bdellovibrionales bacterium]MBT7766387.1 putative beta-lysine N-acetyltransferase [Bdellovibrionales bacterium]